MKKRNIILIASAIVAAGLVTAGGAAAFGGWLRPAASLPTGFSGPVTQQVYEEAYTKFAGCMSGGGAALVGEHKVGAVNQFSYAADAQPVYDACYADFSGIDFAWQVANSYDSPTYVKLRSCLVAVGVQPGRDVETVWQQVQAANIDVFTCTLGEGN